MFHRVLNNPLVPTMGEGISSVLGVIAWLFITAVVIALIVWVLGIWKPKARKSSRSQHPAQHESSKDSHPRGRSS